MRFVIANLLSSKISRHPLRSLRHCPISGEYLTNAHAQIVVALANTKVHYAVYCDVMREKGQPFTLDDFIQQTESLLAEVKDEIPKRRLMWFLMASIIYSLGDGNGDAEVEDRLVQMFILMADASELMMNVLEHNILWSDNEKAFFPDRHMANRKATMQLYLPKALKKHPRAKAYARQHDFWL